jgi:bifunctional DNA-binding transcriptional regulator/antitoxin component of YhaV-PrlF toxin-antitoxin module
MNNHWTVTLEEDPETGELILPIPDEACELLGLEVGDSLQFDLVDDGSIVLSKLATELVLVECVNQFRMRYLVEVPKGKQEWALDTVTMNEAKEFSQEHIGESIVSSRVISKQDAMALCKQDNNYMFTNLNRPEQEILSSFITREVK